MRASVSPSNQAFRPGSARDARGDGAQQARGDVLSRLPVVDVGVVEDRALHDGVAREAHALRHRAARAAQRRSLSRRSARRRGARVDGVGAAQRARDPGASAARQHVVDA